MRILVISNLCPPDYDGGFELSAFRNAQSLIEAGHEVEFVTSRYRNQFAGERSGPAWVHRIFSLAASQGGWSNISEVKMGDGDLRFKPLRALREFRTRRANLKSLTDTLKVSSRNEAALRHFLLGREFDAVYVFGLHFLGTSMLHAATERGLPILYHHGDEWMAFYLRAGLVKRMLLNIVSPRVYKRERSVDLRNIYLVSEFMRQRFLEVKFSPAQLGVIHRGISFTPREDIARERYSPAVFLIASRLTHYKGIQVAIKAAKVLDTLEPDSSWELWIAGHGDARFTAYLEELVVTKKIQHRVKFLGKLPQAQVVEAMNRATAVISPSIFDEPFGNTNIEAMGSGTPLIASRSGAIEEIVDDGVSGLIYSRSNTAELASCMQRILGSPELREALARNGIARVYEKFTQKIVIAQVEAKLADLAGIELVAERDQARIATLR